MEERPGAIVVKTKCDMVTEQLLGQIVNGTFKMGSKLPPENALCEQFGVSRITIRESLKRLNTMGIVTIEQGRGTFVNQANLGLLMKPMIQMIEFDDLDIETIYDARLYVEEGICRLAAANRTEEDLEILHRLLDDMEREEHLVVEDSLFHIALATASKNPLLKATIMTLEDISNACVERHNLQGRSLESAAADHRAIVAAIEARDTDGAAAVMRRHTLGAKELFR